MIRPYPIITEDEAMTLLIPYSAELTDCFYRSWNDWKTRQQNDVMFASALSKRSRANFISDFTWRYIQQTFYKTADNHVIINDTKGIRHLIIKDRIILRFKKLNSSLQSGNIQTIQQILLNEQLPLPGFLPLSRLTIGYCLNKLETDIEFISVVCQEGRNILWSRMIQGSAMDKPYINNYLEASEVLPRTTTIKIKSPHKDEASNQS